MSHSALFLSLFIKHETHIQHRNAASYWMFVFCISHVQRGSVGVSYLFIFLYIKINHQRAGMMELTVELPIKATAASYSHAIVSSWGFKHNTRQHEIHSRQDSTIHSLFTCPTVTTCLVKANLRKSYTLGVRLSCCVIMLLNRGYNPVGLC